MSATVYDVWLSLHTLPGSTLTGKLIEIFGDAEQVYRASDEAIMSVEAGAKDLGFLKDKRLDRAYDILRFCERSCVSVIKPGDEAYPKKLEAIGCPPRLLYVRGTMPDMDSEVCVGMVGTRNMSVYGMEQAYRISYELASSGAVIVSGMARGIDGVSAVAAIEAGGKTVAVTGTGINVVFPAEHGALAEEIARHGAVVTEYPPDDQGLSWHFPQRNRIINGLSDGVTVVEAGSRSGAVITANYAFDEGRRVFAVPGNVNRPNSMGSNALMRRGALPILGAEDIIAVFNGEEEKRLSESRYAEATLHSACNPCTLLKYGVGVPDELSDNGGRGNYTRSEKPAQKTAAGKKEPENKAPEPVQVHEPPEGRMHDLWSLFPEDKAVSPDFFTDLGYPIGETVNLLSMLEISGYVKSVPGGMYRRI